VLIAAEYEAPDANAPPPPEKGRGRGFAFRRMVPDSFTILVVGK
jgi:hypothetical protein